MIKIQNMNPKYKIQNTQSYETVCTSHQYSIHDTDWSLMKSVFVNCRWVTISAMSTVALSSARPLHDLLLKNSYYIPGLIWTLNSPSETVKNKWACLETVVEKLRIWSTFVIKGFGRISTVLQKIWDYERWKYTVSPHLSEKCSELSSIAF